MSQIVRRLIAILFLTYSALIIQGCSRDAGSSVKFGAIFPLTGNIAFLGGNEAAALRIAVDEMNASQGPRVTMVLEDSRSEAKSAVAAARKLIDIDHIQVGMVSTSALSNSVLPVFREAGIPLITICSDDAIPVQYPRAVNIYTHLASEQETMAGYMVEQGIHSIGVIRVNAQITLRGSELLTKLGQGQLRIISEETYELGAPEFRGVVTKTAAKHPDVIYLMGYGVEYPALVRTIREVAPKMRVLGNYTFLSEASRKSGTELYKGIDFTSFTATPAMLAGSDFGQRLSQAVGHKLGPFLDYVFVYAAARAWHQLAVESVPLPEIAERMRNRSFDTMLGPMKIDSTGNAVVGMAIAAYGEDGEPSLKWSLGH